MRRRVTRARRIGARLSVLRSDQWGDVLWAYPRRRHLDHSGALPIVLYICRVVLVTLIRKCSPQTAALLAALMQQPRAWQHGYELSKETGLKSGTLYPILIRLGEQGLLNSRWKDAERPGRPPRHVYRLTATGLALGRGQGQAAEKSDSGLKPIKAGAR